MEETKEEVVKVPVLIEAKSNELVINLHELTGFGSGDIDHFPINKRRVYLKLSANIAGEYDRAINEQGYEFVLGMAHFKQKCLDGTLKTDEDLQNELQVLLDPYFENAFKYCDETYKVEIIIAAQNEELQFERCHIVTLLACTMLYRLAIPLITSFIADTGYDECKPEELFLMYFIYALRKMEKLLDRPVNIENKLRRLTESRVYGTEYSDAVIWNYLKNTGTNPVEFVQPLYRKLITDIMPKLTMDENVISLIHVVIRKQLQYLFKSNIPLSYETVNSALDSDEASIFDASISKFSQNEIYSVLSEVGIKDMISKIQNTYGSGIEITNSEVMKYFGKIVPSKDKEILFFTFFGKYSGDYEILYTITKKEYTYLCLLLYKILQKYLFPELAKLMITNMNTDEALSISRAKLTKHFLESIKNSEKYTELKTRVFGNIEQRFEKNNTLILLIESATKASRFSIPTEEGKEPEEVAINSDEFASELLKFVSFIV